MHIVGIYAVYDRKAAYYLPLFNSRTDEDALREFTNIVVMSETPVSTYPADFDLMRLGTLDTGTGRIDPEYPVGTLINGLVALQAHQRLRAQYAAVLKPSDEIGQTS